MMPGCRPPCVTTFSGTDRQKWNYVKNLYQPSYGIYENGDIDDPREITDTSFVNDFATYDAQYAEDHAIWLTYYSHVIFEKWIQWKYEYGTEYYGNLAQYFRNDHEGHCWMPCPYSTDSSDERSETMLGFVPVTTNDHGDYFMQTTAYGNVWGYVCTYSGCPYLIANGKAYFYV
jgi:hypothetical protein